MLRSLFMQPMNELAGGWFDAGENLVETREDSTGPEVPQIMHARFMVALAMLVVVFGVLLSILRAA